jgi:small subunit ribosomal protein S16
MSYHYASFCPSRGRILSATHSEVTLVAVKIRLARAGAKKAPYYRVVVADSRARRDGRFIEILGRYNPRVQPSAVELDAEKVRQWLDKGAQMSDTVAKLLAIAEGTKEAPAVEQKTSKKAAAKAEAEATATVAAAAAPEPEAAAPEALEVEAEAVTGEPVEEAAEAAAEQAATEEAPAAEATEGEAAAEEAPADESE